MEKIKKLRRCLNKISPQHDFPVGLVHPYWARKPLNIINAIVEALSRPGDLVADPFMGSGTTVFSALSLGRHVVGSDLNPLSVFVVSSLLGLGASTKSRLYQLEKFVADYSLRVLPWYAWNSQNDIFIERERFAVRGSFENGRFELEPTEIVVKQLVNGVWKSRSVVRSFDDYRKPNIDETFLSGPIDFFEIHLRANSRIAIPKGALLAHYFSERNRAAINLALSMINDSEYDEKVQETLKLLLSSALPLIRLSDKKASSQWPYWRPKDLLTSRNPVIVFGARMDAIKEGAAWINENIGSTQLTAPKKVLSKPTTLSVSIVQCSSQNLGKQGVKSESMDLVITDPPYADQAPYIEYSDMWIRVLGLDYPENILSEEIVKTNAPDRSSDTKEYLSRLKTGLESSSILVREQGYLALFYQDFDLRNWATIFHATYKYGLRCMDVIPLPKQRRSMKTVTSPGRTFDGDLIVIFKRGVKPTADPPEKPCDIFLEAKKVLRKMNSDAPMFDVYAAIIKTGFKSGWIFNFAGNSLDIRRVINKVRKDT